MELQIAGTNVELSAEAQSYIERKLGKLDRYSPAIIEGRVEISEEMTKSPEERYLVRVTLSSGVGGAVFHGDVKNHKFCHSVHFFMIFFGKTLLHFAHLAILHNLLPQCWAIPISCSTSTARLSANCLMCWMLDSAASGQSTPISPASLVTAAIAST